MPRAESIPLHIATMMRMIEYEIKQYKDYKFEEKINFYVLSELLAKQHCRYSLLRQDWLVLFHW